MATQVTMPRLGQGMEAGTITRWLKAEGDVVAKGEPLYEVDTDKVTQEVESDVAGTLLSIVAPEGAEIAVGRPICVIGEPGEEVAPAPTPEPAPAEQAAVSPVADAPVAAASVAVAPPAPEPAVAAPAVEADGGRLKASPLARRIARERGVDLAAVEGTGPEGRVVAEDVERAGATATVPAAAPALAPQPEAEVVKLTSVRKLIAKRLSEAWTAPHFSIAASADMRRVIELRERLVAQVADGGIRPTYSDVLTKLCALALIRHPDANAHFAQTEVRRFRTANIGIAVAIPNGLVVPVIRGCEALTIPELAAARAELVARTRANKLAPADMDGGTFTISNLGMYGVERFTAVLNPPQVAILAVGAIEERAVPEDGQIVIRPRMDLSLSCDHRALDGATAAEFLRTLRTLIEEPGLAL